MPAYDDFILFYVNTQPRVASFECIFVKSCNVYFVKRAAKFITTENENLSINSQVYELMIFDKRLKIQY